ncbi:methylamine utilization protein MauG [Rhodobacteraceae bacterium GS-10]|uniref:Methylamine utilization protein MauG n=2 Tax=Thalassovita mangrovi TaxID=2692236 RepID=A0A6L8LF50_9RHOB|nr:methylamine utilization protein MauG [Thalassovita mangrovi]
MPAARTLTFASVLIAAMGGGGAWAEDLIFGSKEALGEALFFDMDLSQTRSQACASCHQPEYGFADPRGAVSIGDDGTSLGDRNAPTASYAAFSPRFHQREDGAWIGGQFLDGRAATLAEQAGGPPLNPVEMAMPDRASVVERLRENGDYVVSMQALYGADVFADSDRAFEAMTDSIAAFEKTDYFAPFDSKYDRYLRGEVELTPEEDLGRLLFFSEQFTNCNLCHQLQTSPVSQQETFSNYEYHNIGVPVNTAVREANGKGPDYVDNGLLENPAVDDPAQAGKFKVPTLRNVAVTGPYMHNGVFADLRTVVLFYNKYNSKSAKRQINPETGQQWAVPEVDGTLSMEQLTHGPALEDERIDALVAFLKTLTDARYEDLLEE